MPGNTILSSPADVPVSDRPAHPRVMYLSFLPAPAEGSFGAAFLNAIDTRSVLYLFVYFLMIIGFSYFYATIQLFAPEMWRHFYFHPTLNPFAVPRVLGFFLASVWAILILALACLDEVKHRLSLGDAILYLGGLVGVCAVDYIIFSLCTLYYVGYVLLAFYFWFAIRRFLRR